MNMRTILCLYVPGFKGDVFEHAPKRKWTSITIFPWTARTNTCNVVLRHVSFATIGRCSEVHLQLRIPRLLNLLNTYIMICKWVAINFAFLKQFLKLVFNKKFT